MAPRDTSPHVQRLLDEHWREMPPHEKGRLLDEAWRTARALQLAGLRAQIPEMSEAELEERLLERWLGRELLAKVRAVHPA